jgi:hypothetical protein
LITSALLLALQVTLVLCFLVNWRYRAAVLRLMRLAPQPGDADAADSADRVRILQPEDLHSNSRRSMPPPITMAASG